MKDFSGNNQELIEEILSLKKKIIELEQSEPKRKRVEEKLRAPDPTLLEVLDSFNSLIYVADMETYEIIFINRYGKKKWGDIEGTICWQTFQKRKTGPCEFCTNSRLIGPDGNPTGGVIWELENTITQRWYDCHDIAIHWHDGRIVRMEIATDITEEKRAEEELRESESRIRAITDSAQDAILMMDPEGRISYWNPAAERILGYTSSEAIGQNLHALLAPPHYHKAHHTSFPLFQQKGQGVAVGKTIDLEAIRKDGKKIPVQLSLSAVHMKGAWHAVGIIRDITERKMAEEKLLESEKRYREMYDFLPIPVFEMDFEANLTSVNRAVYETFRGTEEEFKRGVSAWKLSSDEDIAKSRKNIERLLKGEQPEETEYILTRLDGSTFPAIVISRLIYRDGNPAGIRGAIVDITDRKQAEEQIRQMAYYDSLTGLPNRKLFSDRLTIALTQAKRNKKRIGLSMLDLDNFKEVND
ncbi:MAG TPA: PAS domain S-box protein, partial [Syntrophales bacterium]|nr:PAS domain S-box protein [Syntrophales bacterium]